MCHVRKEIAAEHGFYPEATHVASCCFPPHPTFSTLSELLCEPLRPINGGNNHTSV